MKLTKKLEKLFEKWKIKVRNKATSVYHQGYRCDTLVEPISFAVYELAVKSHYNQWAHGPKVKPTVNHFVCGGMNGHTDINAVMMERDNEIMIRDGMPIPPPVIGAKRSKEVYFYCINLLKNEVDTDSGDSLYYRLLD